jgi:tRNA A37 methylthiotransferase MiaB
VGFPGETAEQFQATYDLLAELKLDVAHLARYSSRPGTVATRRMVDDVPAEEKMRRFRELENLQENIVAGIHAGYLDRKVDVLFEEKVKGRWKGGMMASDLIQSGPLAIRVLRDDPEDYTQLTRWLSDPRLPEYYEGRDHPYHSTPIGS